MRLARGCFLLFVLLWTHPAWALLDPLAIIEQYESSGQNIQQQVVDPSISSASGYYQVTTTTWNTDISKGTGLPQVGPGTAYARGVMDLPADVQRQGAAFLYNERGFSPWTCPNCNSRLASAIRDAGGADAFTPAGSYDPVNGDSFIGQVPLGSGDPTNLSGASQAQIADLPHPFSDAYSIVSDVVLTKINDAGLKLQLMAGGLFIFVVALAAMYQGTKVWAGEMAFARMQLLAWRVIIAGFLLGGVSWETLGIVQFFTIGLPQWIGTNLGAFAGPQGANPAANWDVSALTFLNILVQIKSGGAWYDFFLPVILGFALLVIITVLAVTFAPFIFLTGAMSFLVALAQLLIMGIPFETTRKYFAHVFDLVVFCLLGYVVTDIFALIFINDLAQQLGAVPLNAGSWTAAIAVTMIICRIVLIGSVMVIGYWITKRVTNASGIPIGMPSPAAVVVGAYQGVRRWG